MISTARPRTSQRSSSTSTAPSYEIDLSATNQERLREKLAKFLDAATPVRSPRGARRPATRRQVKTIPTGREQTQAIRDWAKGAGYEISSRGRVPKNIQDAFEQAH
jgi:hypothetical protein